MSRKLVCRLRLRQNEIRTNVAKRVTTNPVLGDEETEEAEEFRQLREGDLADETVDEGRDEGKDGLAGSRDDPVEREPSGVADYDEARHDLGGAENRVCR